MAKRVHPLPTEQSRSKLSGTKKRRQSSAYRRNVTLLDHFTATSCRRSERTIAQKKK